MSRKVKNTTKELFRKAKFYHVTMCGGIPMVYGPSARDWERVIWNSLRKAQLFTVEMLIE